MSGNDSCASGASAGDEASLDSQLITLVNAAAIPTVGLLLGEDVTFLTMVAVITDYWLPPSTHLSSRHYCCLCSLSRTH